LRLLEERLTSPLEQGSTHILVPDEREQLRVQLRTSSGVRRKAHRKRYIAPFVLILSDTILAVVIWALAYAIQDIWGRGPLTGVAVGSVVPAIAVWVALRALIGMYPGYGLDAVEELRRHTFSLLAALGLLAIFALGFHVGELLSRLLLGLAFACLLLFAPFIRYLVKRGLKSLGLWGKPVVILSYKGLAANVTDQLQRNWELGYNPVAVFGYRLEAKDLSPDSLNDEHALAHAVDLARQHAVDTALFAMPHTRREQLAKLVNLASLHFRRVFVVPNLGGITNSAAMARDLGGTCALEIEYNLLNPWALRAKRIADLAATLFGGILILPIVLMLALLVRLESGSPIFYRDWRMGKDGEHFSCIKFRTMVSEAEDSLQKILEEDPELRAEYSKFHKLRDDPRVTRIGRFLRKTSLDELPQLWNVLRGEMSLVGPRPYLPRESEEIGITQSEILRVPPGITGPWQVSGRNHAFFSERVQIDANYVRDWSMWLDILLLIRTVKTLLFGKGAY
jgi:Undecaprenyl-phosphate galactose phosphotransferase WbaP